MNSGVRLRPVVESELADLVRLLWDPLAPGEFQWFGFRMKTAREIERRWHEDGLIGEESSFLTVDLEDGVCAGWVTWRPVGNSGNYEIGIALFPDHRGHGVGTEAQRQLVHYLFGTTTANRLQAGTEVDNIAERRALERVGFRREGVQRGLYFRAGQWRDSVMYGLLRGETGDERRVAEQQLDGGIANAGRVVRAGPHVLRPSSPHSGSIHAFLRAVRHAGFEGASLPVGVDEDGRERLVFIDGEVPVAPYPDWSQSDAALASIARLLRGLHDAARGFDPQGLTWDDALADPAGGTLVCHNDVELSNVVFRDGIAVALLDFEFAAPGRPVYDVAQLARLCVPIDDDFDQARLGWRPADRPARLRLVADAYGLDRDGRAELLAAMDDAIARIEAAVRRRVDAGDPNFVAMSKRTGGMEKYDRRRRWWTDHHDQFAAALL